MLLSELQRLVGGLTPADRRYSQFNEDAVLDVLVRYLGIARGTFVEIGIGSGWENNTRRLAEDGWRGVWFDWSPPVHIPASVDFVRGEVTQDNILDLLQQHAPAAVDVFSLDIDGNDYWVGVPAIAALAPTIVVVEYNDSWGDQYLVMPYAPGYRWSPGLDFGASIEAWRATLAPTYWLVAANGVNAFFVRRSAMLDSAPCAEGRSR